MGLYPALYRVKLSPCSPMGNGLIYESFPSLLIKKALKSDNEEKEDDLWSSIPGKRG